jgi:hypothetical protein
MRANLPEQEPRWQAFWREIDLYGKMLAKPAPNGDFILHDGPPYSNGDIHIGHALNKTLKDIVVRSYCMRGYRTPYVPGWDNHGMPIENAVSKEFLARGEKPDKATLRRACRDYAQHFVQVQREQFERLGLVGEWDNPYLTMDYAFEAGIVRIFGELVQRGYIYRGLRPTLWCPTCQTALADAEVEYAPKVSDSIYVAFPVVKPPADAPATGEPAHPDLDDHAVDDSREPRAGGASRTGVRLCAGGRRGVPPGASAGRPDDGGVRHSRLHRAGHDDRRASGRRGRPPPDFRARVARRAGGLCVGGRGHGCRAYRARARRGGLRDGQKVWAACAVPCGRRRRVHRRGGRVPRAAHHARWQPRRHRTAEIRWRAAALRTVPPQLPTLLAVRHPADLSRHRAVVYEYRPRGASRARPRSDSRRALDSPRWRGAHHRDGAEPTRLDTEPPTGVGRRHPRILLRGVRRGDRATRPYRARRAGYRARRLRCVVHAPRRLLPARRLRVSQVWRNHLPQGDRCAGCVVRFGQHASAGAGDAPEPALARRFVSWKAPTSIAGGSTPA